ncbi:MAG: glycosyltransferase family 4 protein [Chloroflexaceae bacterium]|jgi:UDP-N-acetylmuramyl pentapeptide phosphotransferase/UDP-N-acetylglucosamine-1-phosphate transferase|nr:glycosyltransferase family 4 protein [Chloroflexaceae bacterium]
MITVPLLIASGVLAAIIAYVGVFGLRAWAARRMLDIPNERSSHSRPTPRGGGLAIVVVTLAGLLLAGLLLPAWPLWALVGLLVGAALIATVSWFDDLKSLSNRLRFGVHTLAALLLIASFGFWQHVSLPLVGTLTWGWLGLPITLLWLVGLTNAYNFMDGIDGIASSQAVVAGLGWLLLGSMANQPLVAMLGLLLAAASLGFLGHNWPPARIFMGDVGSAFLGFSFAALPVIAAQTDSRLALAGVLLVWPFVFDTALTFLRRWRNGENVFAAHRSHLYQRLVIAGASHRSVSCLYVALAAVGLPLALGWVSGNEHAGLVALLLVPLLALLLVAFVGWYVRTRAVPPPPPAPAAQPAEVVPQAAETQ